MNGSVAYTINHVSVSVSVSLSLSLSLSLSGYFVKLSLTIAVYCHHDGQQQSVFTNTPKTTRKLEREGETERERRDCRVT